MPGRLTEEELTAIFSERFEEGCSIRWGNLILERELFDPVMNLALQSDRGVIPFRAAYALERAFVMDPERFEPYYKRFIADFPTVTHKSVWRHYGKIMAILLKKKRLELTGKQAERIAEAAVERLVDESVPVGARVWSLDILYYLRMRVEWVDRELPGILEQLKIAPTPAMVSRLRKYEWMKRY